MSETLESNSSQLLAKLDLSGKYDTLIKIHETNDASIYDKNYSRMIYLDKHLYMISENGKTNLFITYVNDNYVKFEIPLTSNFTKDSECEMWDFGTNYTYNYDSHCAYEYQKHNGYLYFQTASKIDKTIICINTIRYKINDLMNLKASNIPIPEQLTITCNFASTHEKIRCKQYISDLSDKNYMLLGYGHKTIIIDMLKFEIIKELNYAFGNIEIFDLKKEELIPNVAFSKYIKIDSPYQIGLFDLETFKTIIEFPKTDINNFVFDGCILGVLHSNGTNVTYYEIVEKI